MVCSCKDKVVLLLGESSIGEGGGGRQVGPQQLLRSASFHILRWKTSYLTFVYIFCSFVVAHLRYFYLGYLRPFGLLDPKCTWGLNNVLAYTSHIF